MTVTTILQVIFTSSEPTLLLSITQSYISQMTTARCQVPGAGAIFNMGSSFLFGACSPGVVYLVFQLLLLSMFDVHQANWQLQSVLRLLHHDVSLDEEI
jgi:hypothetical protein